MSLQFFQISETASLREAMEQIDSNHHRMVLTINASGGVTGLVTDGDVRRKLLDGATLEDAVSSCANPDFVWADSKSSRELLLKQLDSCIQVIPLLNGDRSLAGVVTRDYLPRQIEEPIYARARSPVRISFGGGGSDLTHYFEDQGGAVINATISLFSHATLRKRDDSRILIYSRDLSDSLQAPDLAHALALKGSYGLLQALLKAIHPEFGFELYLQSDFPMGSGLGGSAVISSAVLGLLIFR